MRLLLVFILVFSFVTLLSGQDYSSFDCDVSVNGKVLAYPFTGGFDAPQFSHGDFNQDGVLDLFVFDRRGDVSMMFEYSGSGLSTGYTFTRDNKQNLPFSLIKWAKMKDYNGDGLYDIFGGNLGVSGASLHKAERGQDGELTYSLQRSDGVRDIVLNYENTNGMRLNAYVANTDIPEFVDLDNDGDMDMLAFDSGGSFVRFYENRQMDKNLPSDSMDLALIRTGSISTDIGDWCFGKFKEATLDATIILSSDPNECSNGFQGHSNVEKSGLHAGSTIMAFDNDNDGDLELLIGDLNTNSLVFLENGGTADNGWMTLVSDSFPMYDRSSKTPQFAASYSVDVDNDGLNDIITSVNSINKTLNFDNILLYKNTGDPTEPYRYIQDDFLTEETVDLGSFTAPVFLDENADGLIDILVGSGGYYNNSGLSTMFLALFRNVGSPTTPQYELVEDDYLGFSAYQDITSINPAPAAGDLDGDGDVDLLISAEGVLFYYENLAGPDQPMQFGNPDFGGSLSEGYMNISGGTNAKVDMADINGDGLMDIVIGELNLNSNNTSTTSIIGNLAYYQNIGGIGAPTFDPDLSVAPNNPALGGMHSKYYLDNFSTVSAAPHFFMTNDELHVMVGSEFGILKSYRIEQDDLEGPYTPTDSIVGGILEGLRTTPSLADIDMDGFMEMVVGNARGGLSMFNTDIQSKTVSTQDLSNTSLRVYPNPTKDQISLELDENLNPSAISIYSVEGKLVKAFDGTTREISLAEMSSGIYLLKILTESGELLQKIIKL